MNIFMHHKKKKKKKYWSKKCVIPCKNTKITLHFNIIGSTSQGDFWVKKNIHISYEWV